MGIKNNFLNDVAQAIYGEDLLTHVAFSEEPQTTGASIETFTDEIGDRVSLSKSIMNNKITLSGIRSGSVVTTPETINATGWFVVSTGGTVKIVRNTPNIIHTENFDIETILELTVRRRS
jgi:hypothetical protein